MFSSSAIQRFIKVPCKKTLIFLWSILEVPSKFGGIWIAGRLFKVFFGGGGAGFGD